MPTTKFAFAEIETVKKENPSGSKTNFLRLTAFSTSASLSGLFDHDSHYLFFF